MEPRELSAEEERALWERLLSTPTEVEFRQFVFAQVDLDPEGSVLSVGSGPGFETEAIARRLGTDGRVTGIDANGAVLAAARDRCGDLPQVSFVRGDATRLPVANKSYDLAVAKQVLSAVTDIESALSELFRVVTPGGRAVVTAGDARTHVKHTPTDRLERADEVFRSETSGRQLGTRLVTLLPAAGFTIEEIVPRAKIQTNLNEQVDRGIDVQRGVLEASDAFDEPDLDAWERELRTLARDNQFLACSTAFVYVARKPG